MNETTENEVIETATPEAETPQTAPEAAPDASAETAKGMFDPPPETSYERAIADYLEANASDALREKIADARKNGKGIAECYEYITEQARKEANNSNSVMIADAVVYGWAVHYFEDEWQAEIEREKEEKEKRKATAERLKREAAERKAKAEKAEAERIAAMTPEEREAEERAKAESEKAKREAEERKRKLAEAQLTFNF